MGVCGMEDFPGPLVASPSPRYDEALGGVTHADTLEKDRLVHQLRDCCELRGMDAELGFRLASHAERGCSDLDHSFFRHLAAVRRLHPNAHAPRHWSGKRMIDQSLPRS
jgi:hypothetical protein